MCGSDFLCARALISEFRYAKEDNDYKKGLLAVLRWPNVDFQQSKISAEDHLVDSSPVLLVTVRKISVAQSLWRMRKTEFAGLLQLGYIQKHFHYVNKTLGGQKSVSFESIEEWVQSSLPLRGRKTRPPSDFTKFIFFYLNFLSTDTIEIEEQD